MARFRAPHISCQIRAYRLGKNYFTFLGWSECLTILIVRKAIIRTLGSIRCTITTDYVSQLFFLQFFFFLRILPSLDMPISETAPPKKPEHNVNYRL